MEVNDAIVECLVRDQRPNLVDGSLVRVANGWDNVTFRLGEDLAVRPPHVFALFAVHRGTPAPVASTASCKASKTPVPGSAAGRCRLHRVHTPACA